MARVKETPLFPESPLTPQTRVRDWDLPTEQDVIGIAGLPDKTYTFVRLMQCGITDYAVLRERTGKTVNSMAPQVTPELAVVYFVERHSQPKEKPAVVKAERARASVTLIVSDESVAPTPAATPAPEAPAKRGRGRPRKTGNQPASQPVKKIPGKRGRPRKAAC